MSVSVLPIYTHGVCRGTSLPDRPHLNFAAEDPRVFAE